MATLMNLTNLQKILQDFANDIRDNYKEHLEHNDRHTRLGKPSGYNDTLIDSVKTHVVVGDKEYLVTIDLNDYWKYVEEDTKPHFPPLSAIQEWISIKPVIPRPDKKGRIPSTQQLSFLIARSISKEGTKGTHDLEKVTGNVLNWYRDRISEALGRDMEAYIGKVMAE